jgi:hypothetical protein
LLGQGSEPQKQAEPATTEAKTQATEAADEYVFTAPEGQEFDPEILKTYSETAKELKIGKDAAQKMLDKIAPAMQERQQRQVDAINKEWIETVKADKEYGGEKLSENLAVAKKALDTFATPEFKSFLEESRLGNNPEVIRFMLRVGRAISEDKFVAGASTSGKSAAPKTFNDLAAALYSSKDK